MYICDNLIIHFCVCIYTHPYIYTHTRISLALPDMNIEIDNYTYIHAYIHACMRAYMHTYIYI